MTGRYSFTLTQGGMVVASGDAPDFTTAYREGRHYGMMYAQDGPVALEVRDPDGEVIVERTCSTRQSVSR